MSFSFHTKGRVNLLGNPSDIYYGIVISSTIENLGVKGTIKESEIKNYTINGTYDEGLNTLVNNSIVFLKQKGLKINPFTFSVNSNIPKQAGLAGSSAIIINLLNCLNKLYQCGLDQRTIAQYVTVIEHEVIGITAGPADRFIITLGGTKYMDFTSKDYKKYLIEDLDLKSLPLWIGIRTKDISSGDVHRFPYQAYPKNFELQQVIKRIMKCAVLGKKAVEEEDIQSLGKILNKNQKLTNLYGTFGNPNKNVQLQRKIDEEILNFCNENGTIGAKLGGSSGSLIILSEERPEFLFDFKPSRELRRNLTYDSSYPEISEIIRLKSGRKN
ncbi:MAG: mevalonate kinase [Promethearchaeota archaeon]